MPAAIGVIADDLTGAADAAVGFVRANLSAVVTWTGAALEPRVLRMFDVVAIDARTRVLSPDEAQVATAAAVASVVDLGVTTLCKKLDSTLRGHIGPEVHAALERWHRGSLAIVAPAFPAMGRTTIDGRQRVNGVPLDRASIPALLEDAGIQARRADLMQVRSGALQSVFEACLQDRVGAMVCDAETEADLREITAAGMALARRVVWVGSGGLTRALAGHVGSIQPRLSRVATMGRGGILIVVGSASEMARQQVVSLGVAGVPMIEIAARALAEDDEGVRATLRDQVKEDLAAGDIVVTLSASASQAENAELVRRLADVLAPCVPLMRGLIVTGGETATHLLRICGTQALSLIEELEPGLPLGITIGGRSFPIITKAGAFGDPATLVRARTRLREMTSLDPRGWPPEWTR